MPAKRQLVRERAKRSDTASSAPSINAVVDAALRESHAAARDDLLGLRRRVGTATLAERVRQRAAVLGRRERESARAVHAQRDALIEDIYAAAASRRWHSAWCDGAARPGGAGLGVILRDPDGQRLASIARALDATTPLAAEIAACEAALRLARAHHVRRLRLHTDCRAIADGWRKRDQPALAPSRELAQDLDGFELRVVPRLHNQSVNALAREAAGRVSGRI